ncbi:MAG: hypothetical protein F6K42_26580, partial [Leptolyngbya sp. SIO1D8]|nr:hypothetical protein [Leptolyngbya sp. SIO1D8]
QTVSKSKEGMFVLETKMGAITEQIVNLSTQAKKIGTISQLVSEFANQTNMLALNSSVEAARAGEHGQGFAIVADEIRKLADQSQSSAEEINQLSEVIQKAIHTTITASEEGTKTVEASVQIAQHTETSFNVIKDTVSQVVLNNQQMSQNFKQQVSAIQEVVEAMECIDRGARETATGLSQTKAGTAHLNEVSITLKNMV